VTVKEIPWKNEGMARMCSRTTLAAAPSLIPRASDPVVPQLSDRPPLAERDHDVGRIIPSFDPATGQTAIAANRKAIAAKRKAIAGSQQATVAERHASAILQNPSPFGRNPSVFEQKPTL